MAVPAPFVWPRRGQQVQAEESVETVLPPVDSLDRRSELVGLLKTMQEECTQRNPFFLFVES